MTAKNRMKPLLAMADNNPEISSISVRRFEEAGVYEKVCAEHRAGGLPLAQALRTEEMRSYLDPTRATMLLHHVKQAQKDPGSFNRQVFENNGFTGNGDKANCGFIFKYPDYLLGARLAACFEFCDMWDVDGKLRKRFYAWKTSLLERLHDLDRTLPRGKGKYKRRFAAFAVVWWELYPALTNLLDDMVATASGE